ncbi:MAG: hypothetical protein IKN96_05780 [Oscillibacter sp.]|nr:hypothetical protein [Oscillibacter sp.]
MSRTRWKRRNCRGETLFETLLSLLVATLALTMLAGMIFKSSSLLNRSMGNMSDYTERLNLLNNPSATASMTKEELDKLRLASDDATVTISIASGDTTIATISDIPVCYVLDKTGVTPAVSYVKSGA